MLPPVLPAKREASLKIKWVLQKREELKESQRNVSQVPNLELSPLKPVLFLDSFLNSFPLLFKIIEFFQGFLSQKIFHW